MLGIPIIIIGAVAIIVIFFLINKKNVVQEREGVVKEILNKDALVVEFDGQKPTVVKLYGITPASENEMLDDSIFEFLYENVRGQRVRVKPIRVDTGEVMVSSVHTIANEYVNATLVRQGFARWSPSEAPEDRDIMEAQSRAKEELVGVWNPAVRQLMEEKMKKAASGDFEDEEFEDLSSSASEEMK